MARRRETVAIGKSFPYDREVEWIGTDGSQGQYVNTGIIGRPNLGIDADFSVSSIGIDNVFWGWLNNGGQFTQEDSGSFRTRFGIGSVGVGYVVYGAYGFNIRYHATQRFTPTSQDFSIDGTHYTYSCNATYGGECEIFISTVNYAGTAYGSGFVSMRIYGFKIYDGTTLLQDLIPVVKSVGGVDTAYLYDKVTGNMLGNAGAGAFTWGELSASANGGV